MSSHSLSVKLLVYGIDSKTAFLFNLSLSSEIPNGFYRDRLSAKCQNFFILAVTLKPRHQGKIPFY
ncbi:hypothetical protein NDI37_10960, partial [Funiculus sociatus GB2-A5]